MATAPLISTISIALRLPNIISIGPRLDSITLKASKALNNLYINQLH
jgi:hypothetical protein